MPRKLLLKSKILPYHITARSNNREHFPGKLEYLWKVFTNELYLQFIVHEVRIHSFVLMPNHFHLLLTTPVLTIDKVMQQFMGSSTRIINTKYTRTGHIFGSRYHWSVIDHPLYYAHAFKYVYRNPVKADICETVGDYPLSTYSGLIGSTKLPLVLLPPLEERDLLLPQKIESLDQWLNQAHAKEEAQAIQKAMKKKLFKLPVNRKTRKPERLPEIDAPLLPKGSDTKWWALTDLNHRPPRYEREALTS